MGNAPVRDWFAAAATVALGLGVPSALQADLVDHHHVDVEIRIGSFVVANLEQGDISWSPGLLARPEPLGGGAFAPPPQRAVFSIVANHDYFLTVHAPHMPSGGTDSFRHVRFDGQTPGSHLAGTLFLDRDVDRSRADNGDILPWNGESGHIVTDSVGPGQHRWGLGLHLKPDRSGMPPGGFGRDVFTATARVTVSLTP